MSANASAFVVAAALVACLDLLFGIVFAIQPFYPVAAILVVIGVVMMVVEKRTHSLDNLQRRK